MSDYKVLQQKFNNFKVFVKEISRKRDQISKFDMLSDDQWLLLVHKNIVPHFNNNSLDTVVNEMIDYLDIDKTNEENVTKLTRYLSCFAEFLQDKANEEVYEHISDVSIDIDDLKDSDDPYLKQLADLKF